jgi:hypothetical protein
VLNKVFLAYKIASFFYLLFLYSRVAGANQFVTPPALKVCDFCRLKLPKLDYGESYGAFTGVPKRTLLLQPGKPPTQGLCFIGWYGFDHGAFKGVPKHTLLASW